MDSDLKAKWITALRGGKYQQTTYNLKDETGFCCLGVLCDIQGADFSRIKNEYGTLSLSCSPPEYLGTLGSRSSQLSMMNDAGKTFSEIADYIDNNL